MDKLSELSKPVAWIIGEESIEEFTRGYETFVVRGDDVDSTEETMKLYSQEYVSALLAELEFEKQNNAGVAGMVEDYETKLEVKDKRIEALERINQAQDDHINQQQDRIDSLEKTNAGLGQRLGAAEKRLATPVRLSCETHPRCRTQHAKDVRAAGFTVTVKRDEEPCHEKA